MATRKTSRGLTEEEERFVCAIADGANHTKACEVAKVSRNTGYSFLRRGHVQEAIASRLQAREESSIRIKEEVRATRTKVVLSEVDEKLKEAVGDAVDTIINIMKNGKRDVDKLAACDRIIKLSGIAEHQTINTEKTSSRRGLSEEAATEIRRKILGITDDGEREKEAVLVQAESVPVEATESQSDTPSSLVEDLPV